MFGGPRETETLSTPEISASKLDMHAPHQWSTRASFARSIIASRCVTFDRQPRNLRTQPDVRVKHEQQQRYAI
jgi:hypothetical protein